MSFGGAECSAGANPLAQFQKHVQGETSMQNDRLAARGPSIAGQGFRNAGATGPTQDEMVNGFLNQQPGMAPGLPMVGPMLQFNPQQMQPIGSASMAMAPNMTQAAPGFSAAEFVAFNQAQAQAPTTAAPVVSTPEQMAQHSQQPMMMTSPMNMVGIGMGVGMMGQMGQMGQMPMHSMMPRMQQPAMATPSAEATQATDVKGKGKQAINDEQWEDMFKAIDLAEREAAEAAREAELNEREIEELDKGMVHESETNYGDFESIWQGIQAENVAAAERMRDQLNAKNATDKTDETEPGYGDFVDFGGDWNHYAMGDPAVEEYMFEPDNLFAGKTNAFEEGVKIMKEGGNLSLAALAFEAAVQQDPTNVAAWVYLGNAQAQNEKESPAIRAHEQALKLDPNNLTALMSLAVSYINEGYESTAYRTLERWLSVKYPQVISSDQLHEARQIGYTERDELHKSVTSAFIKAARLSPNGEHMDPDVQVGLGVLFYGSDDFNKAIDCFSAALASVEVGSSSLKEEQTHLLWNRLGATLANSGRSEDAIQAYQNALRAQPNFVRARYNLGVSCINMGCLEEAAQHFLLALDMHKSIEKEGRNKAYEILGGGSPGNDGRGSIDEKLNRMSAMNQSTTLYDTLRRVFTQMNRPDLADRVRNGVDPETFMKDIPYKK